MALILILLAHSVVMFRKGKSKIIILLLILMLASCTPTDEHVSTVEAVIETVATEVTSTAFASATLECPIIPMG